MNYADALGYLYSLSDFERGGVYTRSPEENIPREARLLELLGNPHHHYTCTLIAGTKGKGSTAVCIERVLRQAGLRTGLYTQPDLHTFRERIRVNGVLIREQEMADLIEEMQTVIAGVQERKEFRPFITYEVATALALLYFARQGVQHAVLEVGLGGRLDATNVVTPLVSVITSISYDHMQILGNTLTAIATEKAGIIKPDGTLVTSAQAPEALRAIAAVCKEQKAQMIRVGSEGEDAAREEVVQGILPAPTYRYRLEGRSGDRQVFTVWTPTHTYTGLEIPLVGEHQLENATAAIATLDMLREKGIAWDEQALREGLATVSWSGRIEVVGHEPTIVVDGAHNADSIHKLIQALRTSFTFHRLIVVLSVTRDKDLQGMIKELADVDMVILTRMANPRVVELDVLEKLFAEEAPGVQLYRTEKSAEAIQLAVDLAQREDLICATGSLYLVAEALQWVAAQGNTNVQAEIEGVDH